MRIIGWILVYLLVSVETSIVFGRWISNRRRRLDRVEEIRRTIEEAYRSER